MGRYDPRHPSRDILQMPYWLTLLSTRPNTWVLGAYNRGVRPRHHTLLHGTAIRDLGDIARQTSAPWTSVCGPRGGRLVSYLPPFPSASLQEMFIVRAT